MAVYDVHIAKMGRTLAPAPASALTALALALALAGCGGGGDSAMSGANTSVSRFSGSGSSGGSSRSAPSNGTTIFQQPLESGIVGNLYVPLASSGSSPRTGVFALVLWQPNPNIPSGLLVPTDWDAGSLTGFTPAVALDTAQLGFQDQAGTTTAQMDGDMVGAYLNSADLPPVPAGQNMMITPRFTFPRGSEPAVFVNPNALLGGSMDLQIPTAVGNITYVNLDLLFEDASGVRITYGVGIFHNNARRPAVSTVYDAPSDSYILNSPLGVEQRFVTQAPGSASWTGLPWAGWRHFEWSISAAQFSCALNYLTTLYSGVLTTTDPADYQLIEVHLNAEIHFHAAPAELGWSMRRLSLWTAG